MKNTEKIELLREKINKTLSSIIGPNENVVLTDLPYHSNIGDLLIWEGERQYLKEINCHCLNKSSSATFTFPDYSSEITLLLHGGGNFGDIWRASQEFRLKVISRYKQNKIILFPQSVYYMNQNLVIEDSQIFSAHKHLFLCARDLRSYHFLRSYFPKNEVMLVPDMAFYISESVLTKYRNVTEEESPLYIRRKDKETCNKITKIPGCQQVDWPSLEHHCLETLIMSGMLRFVSLRFSCDWQKRVADLYADRYLRQFLVELGCKLLGRYPEIITDRLHAMILGVLLHKNVYYIDNNSGKLSTFVETWFEDLDSVARYLPTESQA